MYLRGGSTVRPTKEAACLGHWGITGDYTYRGNQIKHFTHALQKQGKKSVVGMCEVEGGKQSTNMGSNFGATFPLFSTQETVDPKLIADTKQRPGGDWGAVGWQPRSGG